MLLDFVLIFVCCSYRFSSSQPKIGYSFYVDIKYWSRQRGISSESCMFRLRFHVARDGGGAHLPLCWPETDGCSRSKRFVEVEPPPGPLHQRSCAIFFLMSRPPLLAGPVAQRESSRTLSACVCVEGRGDPGYRFAQPGANVLAALPGCWFARRRREGN